MAMATHVLRAVTKNITVKIREHVYLMILYRAYAGGVVIIFKRMALIILDHVSKDVRHFECTNMTSSSCDGTSFSYSKYYLELKGDAKKRYDDKLKLINCTEDPYCRMESPESFSGAPIQWHEWPDLMYADIII